MDIIWKQRKRNWMGLPWTFTVYSYTKDRLFVKKGFFSVTEDEVRFYRILDLSFKQGFWQRLCGMATIVVDSSDKTLGKFELKNIRHARDVKEELSNLVEEERERKRISTREYISDGHDHDFDHDHFDDDDHHMGEVQ